MTWNDFNDLDEHKPEYSLIPAGTIAKVKMNIKRGGYDNKKLNCTDGYASFNAEKGYVFLEVKFVVLHGPYANKCMWTYIGLHSDKSEQCANIARVFIKGIVSSARGLSLTDNSDQARTSREIKSLSELDGLEFVARIEIEKRNSQERNIVKWAVTRDHSDYETLMNQQTTATLSAKANTAPPSVVPNTISIKTPAWFKQ
jgi:hypothetical protein